MSPSGKGNIISSTAAKGVHFVGSTVNKTKQRAQDMGIIPPLQPVPPAYFALLLLITGAPICAWVMGFSAMGWGRQCMKVRKKERKKERKKGRDHLEDNVHSIPTTD